MDSILLFMVSIGTANVYLKEYLVRFHALAPEHINLAEVRSDSGSGGFNHPFFFNQMTMTGMLCFLSLSYLWGFGLTHLANRRYPAWYPVRQAAKAGLRVSIGGSEAGGEEAPWHVYLVTAGLQYVTLLLVNMNYAVLTGSVIQMLRGSKVMFTLLLSVHVLKKRMCAYHAVGAMFCMMGCIIVGFDAVGDGPVASPESAAVPRQKKVLAVTLCVVSELVRSIWFVYQESSVRRYEIPAVKLTGMVGLAGATIGCLCMAAANAAGIEDTRLTVKQMSLSIPLTSTVFVSCTVSALFEMSSIVVTKRYSAMTRSLVELVRTMLLWVVELRTGYQSFGALQVIGFCFLVAGLLMSSRTEPDRKKRNEMLG